MTTQGPLGNKQVRVEDWISLTPTGDVGTSAANTVEVTASAGALPAGEYGSYFVFSQPEPNAQEPGKTPFRWYVWYNTTGSAVNPLPRESNQPGIEVAVSSGLDINDLAASTAAAINAYFTANPPAKVRASATTATVTIINAAPGRARVADGIGDKAGVAVSTGFTFASSIPGVLPATVSFTVASTIEGSGSLGASIQQIIPQVTDGIIASSYSVANDGEQLTVTMPADATGWPASAAPAAHWQLFSQGDTGASAEDYYVWYSVEGAATDPGASGTGIEVNSVASADLAASIATKTASSINAVAAFSATASAGTVNIILASTGAAADAVDVDASVGITVTQQGGGDFTVDFSNRFANPDFDISSD